MCQVKSTFRSPVLLLITCFLVIWKTRDASAASDAECNALYITEGVDVYAPGRCVTFHECPPLKGLLRSSSLTSAELRLLQNLTCTMHPENPTICCALKDILDLVNYNEPSMIKPVKTSSVGQIIMYPATSANKLPPQQQLPPTASEDGNGIVSATGPFFNEDNRMRKFKLLPTLEECGLPDVDGSYVDRIVGGKNAEHGSFPWMARIGYESLDSGDVEFFCGATVINHKYILTAAHCTEEFDKSEYKVSTIRLGEYNALTEEDCTPESSPLVNCSRVVDFQVEKIIHHPGYNFENKTNDIELIRVRGYIPYDTPFVKPVCLPFIKEYRIENNNVIKEDVPENKDQFVGKKGTATGWGRVKWNKVDGSDILQEVALPIVSNDECQRNYSTKIRLWDKQMCAGGMVDEDSCGGDSGGPLVLPVPVKVLVQNRNGSPGTTKKLKPKYFQLGITSFGPTHCGIGGLPAVYTKISAYKDWILDNIEP